MDVQLLFRSFGRSFVGFNIASCVRHSPAAQLVLAAFAAQDLWSAALFGCAYFQVAKHLSRGGFDTSYKEAGREPYPGPHFVLVPLF